MKRPTRKKLLSSIDRIGLYSDLNPIRLFKLKFLDENGAELYDRSVDVYNMDDLVAMLMDKSLVHRIVRISSSEFILTKGMCVFFTLMPDKDHRTNIDSEFMERIMRLEVKSYESGR